MNSKHVVTGRRPFDSVRRASWSRFAVWSSVVASLSATLFFPFSSAADTVPAASDIAHSPEPMVNAEFDSEAAAEEKGLEIAKSVQNQFAELFAGMSPAAKRGYENLLNKPYLPNDFDHEVVRFLQREGPHEPPLDLLPIEFGGDAPIGPQSFYERFGLSGRPESPDLPLQYVVTPEGNYVMNCFACHGGSLYGASYPGAPNTLYQLASLTENVRRAKIRLGKRLTHMDVGSMVIPLGESMGTSNAVMFGVALMNYRDADLNVRTDRPPASMLHHDMDAPAWWHFHRKNHIYMDGFAEKGHRGLMQFMLVKQNGPKEFQGWEDDFRNVYAFLNELRAPKYPFPIDAEQAERGRTVFETNCASCHGTYGPNSDYPEMRIPIEDVRTDSARLDALSAKHRQLYADSWFAEYGEQDTVVEVDGYVAPPLDGLWASAPYLHNGSVPTLWHLLHPEARPVIWRRTSVTPDLDRMGLQIEELESFPQGLNSYDRRLYFDTARPGKSSQGHDYPSRLRPDEKADLLEYLKTL